MAAGVDRAQPAGHGFLGGGLNDSGLDQPGCRVEKARGRSGIDEADVTAGEVRELIDLVVVRPGQPVGTVAGRFVLRLGHGAQRLDLSTIVGGDHVGERAEERDVHVLRDHALDHTGVVAGLAELDGGAGLLLQQGDHGFVAGGEVGGVLSGHRAEHDGVRIAVAGGARRVVIGVVAAGAQQHRAERQRSQGDRVVLRHPHGTLQSCPWPAQLRASGALGRVRRRRVGRRRRKAADGYAERHQERPRRGRR